MISAYVISAKKPETIEGKESLYVEVWAKDGEETVLLGKTPSVKTDSNAQFDSDASNPFKVCILNCDRIVFRLYITNTLKSDTFAGEEYVHNDQIVDGEAITLNLDENASIQVILRRDPIPETQRDTITRSIGFYFELQDFNPSNSIPLEMRLFAFNPMQNLCMNKIPVQTTFQHSGPNGVTSIYRVNSLSILPDSYLIPTIISDGEFVGNVNICAFTSFEDYSDLKKGDKTQLLLRQSQTIESRGIYYPGFVFRNNCKKNKFKFETLSTPSFTEADEPVEMLEAVCRSLYDRRYPFDYQYFINPNQPTSLSQLYAVHGLQEVTNFVFRFPFSSYSILFFNCQYKRIKVYVNDHSDDLGGSEFPPKGFKKVYWKEQKSILDSCYGLKATLKEVIASTIIVPVYGMDNKCDDFHFYTYLHPKDKVPYHLGTLRLLNEENKSILTNYLLPYVIERTGPEDYLIHPVNKALQSKLRVSARNEAEEYAKSLKMSKYEPPALDDSDCYLI